MNLQLIKPELERYIDEQVRSGNFPTPEAVVENALARMMDSDVELTDEDVEAIQISQQQFARGEGIPAEEAKERVKALYNQARGTQSP